MKKSIYCPAGVAFTICAEGADCAENIRKTGV